MIWVNAVDAVRALLNLALREPKEEERVSSSTLRTRSGVGEIVVIFVRSVEIEWESLLVVRTRMAASEAMDAGSIIAPPGYRSGCRNQTNRQTDYRYRTHTPECADR